MAARRDVRLPQKEVTLAQFLTVAVTGLDEIRDMPGSWTEAEYHALLDALEVTGTSELSGADLEEMLLMALQDLGPEPAADAVLAAKLGDSVTPGARGNIVQDFVDDQRPWEEAADISLHARLFAAGALLQKAFPKNFARPDALRLALRLTAHRPAATELLARPPEAAFVARLLADGMGESSVLERLFDDSLESDRFSEAGSIVWRADFSDPDPGPPPSATLAVYSSALWLKPMEEVEAFESDAHNDGAPAD